MANASKRILVLVTPAEKQQIAKRAKAAGLSMGEYMRRAVAAFRPAEDERALEGVIDQVIKTTTQASSAIDRALASIDASNKRITTGAQDRRTRSRLMGVTEKQNDCS